MAESNKPRIFDSGEVGVAGEQEESIEILYEGPGSSSDEPSPGESIWEWGMRRGSEPKLEVVAVWAWGKVTGYSATLRLGGSTAVGSGGNVEEAKRHAELTMWAALRRRAEREEVEPSDVVERADSRDDVLMRSC